MPLELFAIVDFEDGSRDVPVSAIVQPRKEYNQYKVGDSVVARCPGWPGTHDGEIAAIHSDRSFLKRHVGGPRPICLDSTMKMVKSASKENKPSKTGSGTIRQSVVNPQKDIAETQTERRAGDILTKQKVQDQCKDDLSSNGDNRKRHLEIDDSEKLVHKKVKETKAGNDKQRVTDEAKHVKKMENKEKRDKEKDREEVNFQISRQLTENSDEMENKLDMLLTKVSTLTHAVQSIQSQQQVTVMKVDTLSEMANCSKCMRAKYKLAQKNELEALIKSPVNTPPQKASRSVNTPPPMASRSVNTPPPIASRSETVTAVFMNALPEPSAHQNVSETEEDPIITNEVIPNQLVTESLALDDNSGSRGSALVYLGESQYGIKVKKEDLDRVKCCSKDIIKMALNTIEFLVTPEECKKDLTMYGEGKGKIAVDANKRQALRSELFNTFHQTLSEKEQSKLWIDVICVKLNNKIRGIRNNKYNK